MPTSIRLGFIVCLFALPYPLSAQQPAPITGAPAVAASRPPRRVDLQPIAVQAHVFVETPELAKLPPEPPGEAQAKEGAGHEIPNESIYHGPKTRPSAQLLDPVIQSTVPTPNIPSPTLTFEGINNHCSCVPPDTNGSVGPSNYVEIVNTHLQVFNKSTGAAQTGVIAINSLFAGLGDACSATDDGDPVVLYDPLADRWIITQFADISVGPPFFMSIAISKTPDPTGAYYAYCFQMPNSDLNDYPKFGVWPDGYYMTDNQFAPPSFSFVGAGVFAFDRSKMLVGDPTATYLYVNVGSVDSSIGGVLPSDLDGPPPPIGTPNYFSCIQGTSLGDAEDALRLFQFHADFVNPGSATFTERAESPIAVAAFTAFSPSAAAIPQSGTATNLDSLGDRLMHRLQYRNFTSNETLVVNHTVNGGSAQAAIRYYQLRRPLPSGNFGVYDQATFAPDPLYRWMGSAALDYLGNMAVGYSVSSTTNFPSIRYAGRLASDPTNGLFQGEANLLTGAGSQTGFNRWGDYSGLSVDPSDDTTFWYTQEYYGSTSAFSWQTRVGRFQIATNAPPAPKGTLQGTVTDISSGLPISNVVVRTTSGFFRVTGASGTYSMTVPPGTYTLFASAPCRGAVTNSGVTVVNGGTTTQNITLNSGGATLILTNGATLTTESCLATNGAIDPGETVTVSFGLQNTGCGNTVNLVATLQATGGVTSPSGPQTYGIVTNGGTTVSRPFTFTASGSCGGTITASLQLQDGMTNLGTATFPFTLGATTATTNSFANTGFISIPTSGSVGKSTPYPSTISVPALAGLVSKVTVTISNLNHTWPDDISILLVGPGGQTTMLMSDAGGNAGVTPISNATVTFDDAAATQLPQSTQITSGTYRPGDYDSSETLDAPAPAGPYGTVLSVFTGINPNGTWSLYVDDDFPPSDGGSIANGWEITIITATNVCCTGTSNTPPVITAASISPASPTTTNILTVTGIATNDPDGDSITLAYQWQQSTNNVAFTNLIGQTASTLAAAITVAGDYYRVTLTPNDGHTNGAPFTTASVAVPFDADGNGINDDWEVQYFGHIGINPNADADGTGQNNLFKYVTGLDPTNPASVFFFQVAAITNQLTQDNLLFHPMTNGRTYTPQFNTDLVHGTWMPLTGFSGPVTNGNQVTITDTNATQPNKFYRLDISLP